MDASGLLRLTSSQEELLPYHTIFFVDMSAIDEAVSICTLHVMTWIIAIHMYSIAPFLWTQVL
eukprot:304340-Pleurochrysis_carterae.AAC.1